MTPDELCSRFEAFDAKWAFSAYDRFIDSLEPEARDLLKRKEHGGKAYVAVFGNTQVGKTTLILDLMGIVVDKSARVSKVLRGGRSHGKSATPTAMEYCRSPDTKWRLKTAGNISDYADDIEMEKALGELREKMEERALDAPEACTVSIPSDCFGDDGARGLDVRIVDLPGDKPSNSAEQEHVKEMAKRYLLSADLILLVGKGDHLAFLQPGELTLPVIEDWQRIPSRFRVVTTYSFTAESVRNRILRDKGAASLENVRQELIGQVQRFDSPFSEAAKNPKLYFPLEFGDSWRKVEETQPDFYRLVSPTIETAKEDLLRDMHESVTPIARLYGALDANITIGELKKGRLEKLDEEINEVCDSIGQNKAQQDKLCDILSENQIRQDQLKCKLQYLSDNKLRDDLGRWSPFVLNNISTDITIAPSVNAFRDAASEAELKLKDRFVFTYAASSDNYLFPFWRHLTLDFSDIAGRADKIIKESFKGFLDHLETYWTDGYFFGSESDAYKRDCEQLRSAIETAKGKLKEAAIEWWLEAARTQRRKMEHEVEEFGGSIEIFLYDKKKLENRMIQLKKKQAEILSRKDDVERQYNQDIERCDRFKSLLNDGYHEELDRCYADVFAASNPMESFVELLSSVKMIKDGRLIRDRIRSATK